MGSAGDRAASGKGSEPWASRFCSRVGERGRGKGREEARMVPHGSEDNSHKTPRHKSPKACRGHCHRHHGGIGLQVELPDLLSVGWHPCGSESAATPDTGTAVPSGGLGPRCRTATSTTTTGRREVAGTGTGRVGPRCRYRVQHWVGRDLGAGEGATAEGRMGGSTSGPFAPVTEFFRAGSSLRAPKALPGLVTQAARSPTPRRLGPGRPMPTPRATMHDGVARHGVWHT